MMSSSSKTVSNLARPLSSSKHQADAEEKQEFEMKEDQDNQGGGGEDYFFSNLGSEQERKKRKTKEEEEKPDPEKLKISKNELNHQLVEGKKVDEYEVQGKNLRLVSGKSDVLPHLFLSLLTFLSLLPRLDSLITFCHTFSSSD